MDEKLKKALRTSKQGAWALLILSIILNVILILNTSNILVYLESSWVSVIYMAGLITGLVLYGKEKYTRGAEVIQWTALGNIIATFANVIITCVITGKFMIETSDIIPLIVGALVPIVLMVDALKVIRLTEEPGHVNKVTVPAIIIIAVVVIINILTAVHAKQIADDLMSGSKDQINNEIVNKDDKEDTNKDNEENNEQEDDKQDENEGKEDEGFDPYSNYKNIVWATSKDDGFYIKNDKVYYLRLDGKEEVWNLPGIPVKVLSDEKGNGLQVNVITKEGKVYGLLSMNDYEQILPKEKVIDMTLIDNYTFERYYYLTADGKLIDENGVSYNKYSFVAQYSMGKPYGGISIDKNGYGYHYNYDKKTYEVIISKTNSATLSMSKIYTTDLYGTIIVTSYNKLFKYDGKSNKATQITGDVSSVKKIVDGDNTDLLITFKDGTTKVFDNIIDAYDVKNKKYIDLKSITTFDPYAKYTNMTWRSVTTVDFSESISYKIENGVVYNYDNGKKTKVAGITGTAKKMRTTKDGGGAFSCYVLVDEGVIYRIYNLEKTATKVTDLSKYNIIDITETYNYTMETIYYLTEDGKLIDKNGVSYDKYGFVAQYTLGRPNGGISIDKNGYGYIFNEKTKTYEAILNSANSSKLSISQIFTTETCRIVIITTDNQLFECEEKNNKATKVGGTVLSVMGDVTEGNSVYDQLVILFDANKVSERTTKIYKGLAFGYDVKNKKDIDITKLKWHLTYKAAVAGFHSNLANLRSAVALEYAEQYAAYLKYTNGTSTTPAAKPTASSVAQNAEVAKLLAEVNDNALGVTCKIVQNENGVYVEEIYKTTK